MERLDESQQSFCQAPSGNIRLLAPAGCGKTLCLLFRCKHLAERAKPKRLRFLIVTFTIAAKQELLSRLNVNAEFAELRESLEITTLNSWGFRRIKNAAFSPNLITSKAEYHRTMRNHLQPVWRGYESIKNAIESNNGWIRNNSPRELMNMIDAFKSIGFDHMKHTNYDLFSNHWNEIKNQGLEWRLNESLHKLVKLNILDDGMLEKGEISETDKKEIYRVFFRFWHAATKHLVESSTFTLEDQKYFAYQDERKNIELGRYLSGAASYDHVFVDEFQDINPLDLALVKAIVERNRTTLTIAGDDDQAIFEWRGATPEYILNPDQFFASRFDTYILGVNYRSPANIVLHSQRLILHNSRRVSKKIQASQTEDATLEIRKTDDLTESLDFVHRLIKTVLSQGESPSRLAVIGRKRSQIIPYQVYFASREIPFCAAEDLQIFLSDTFERLLHILTIKERSEGTSRPGQILEDLLSLCDLVKRYPISKKEKQALKSYLQQSRPGTFESAINVLTEYRGPLKGPNSGGRISRLMTDSIRTFLDTNTVSATLMALSSHFEGLQYDFGKSEEDIFYTDPPFIHLAEYALSYKDDYGSFVEHIETAKDTLVHMPPFEEDNQENLFEHPLHLMTALRAKGKEFNTVVLLDVNDGIWPNGNAKTSKQLEAERRVFYVAFTRARKNMIMLVNSRIGNKEAIPSPYLAELGLFV